MACAWSRLVTGKRREAQRFVRASHPGTIPDSRILVDSEPRPADKGSMTLAKRIPLTRINPGHYRLTKPTVDGLLPGESVEWDIIQSDDGQWRDHLTLLNADGVAISCEAGAGWEDPYYRLADIRAMTERVRVSAKGDAPWRTIGWDC